MMNDHMSYAHMPIGVLTSSFGAFVLLACPSPQNIVWAYRTGVDACQTIVRVDKTSSGPAKLQSRHTKAIEKPRENSKCNMPVQICGEHVNTIEIIDFTLGKESEMLM